MLDTSSSMLFPKDRENNKLQFSVYAAASLCELLRQQRDAAGLTLFGREILKHLAPKGSPLHQKVIFNTLEEVLEGKFNSMSTSAAEAIDQVAEIVHQRSLVVVFTDMFESGADNEKLFSALQHLRYRKHEVVLFHVTDKAMELDFEFENKPYRFIDLETGEELKLNPHQLRDEYRGRISTFMEALKIKCGQYKIDLVEADINEGFDKVLYTYLVKRHRMV